MARALTIGNGNILVGIDERAQVRDFYFPYVGHANHVSGASGSYVHRIGVWVDGSVTWLSDSSWNITVECVHQGIEQYFIATNEACGVSLTIKQAVHNEHNVFVRNITITNDRDTARDIRIFFGQEFRISESRRGDTAFYDPRVHSVVHYKGHDAFLIHATINGASFDDYSVGLFGIEGREGTYADASDGVLSKNAIEHGSVDSVIGLKAQIDAHGCADVYYWIAAATSIHDVHELHGLLLTETPERIMQSAWNYWHAWSEKEAYDLSPLSKDIVRLYKQSLMIIRTHADNRGGIIASSDSDMLNQGRDTYSYVWPRDAAISAHALDRAHYVDTSAHFFSFVAPLFEKQGYLMHKYRVDGMLGSSWHPWMRDGHAELPIQEDETALVVYMLGKHYERAKDLEFIESLYNVCIEPAADFMAGYIDEMTGLPSGSYDLWEEKYGTSTYTASAVYGALNVASDLASILGKRSAAQTYRARAQSIKEGILGYLYDADSGMFLKLIRHDGTTLIQDKVFDMSSFHGILFFNVLDPFDQRITRAYESIRDRLFIRTSDGRGGYVRYEGDAYYRMNDSASSNPWCITTLWMAQYYIKVAKTRSDLEPALEILNTMHAWALMSGILPEQIEPTTCSHRSASPLVWSHSEFVITVQEYLEKYHKLLV
jgi:GH15 family glucan-1,4-alpha-glucosidase